MLEEIPAFLLGIIYITPLFITTVFLLVPLLVSIQRPLLEVALGLSSSQLHFIEALN